MKLRTLELFSGTQSFSKIARARGHECTTLDIDPKHGPDLCMSILDWDFTVYPSDAFDFIWASCPCEAFSTARSNAKIPRDEAMRAADKLILKTIDILAHFDCDWVVENPRWSLLWSRDAARPWLEMHASVTSYCRYGFLYRKHTKFASSFPLPLAPPCDGYCEATQTVEGRRCHADWAQRGGKMGSKTHTTDELHAVPWSLCAHILGVAEDVRRVRLRL